MTVEMIDTLPFYATDLGFAVLTTAVAFGVVFMIAFLFSLVELIKVLRDKETGYSFNLKAKLWVLTLATLSLSAFLLPYGVSDLTQNENTDYVTVSEDAGYTEHVPLETIIDPDRTLNGGLYLKDGLLIDPGYCETIYTAVTDDTAKVEAECYVDTTIDRELVTF